MTWIIGIDEAGYGPNLGPLVMSAVACRVPDDLGDCNLWRMLDPVVRQAADDNDGRLVVDDSKLVYSTAEGLGELERGVLSLLVRDPAPDTLHNFLTQATEGGVPELCAEPWYHGSSSVPADGDFVDHGALAERVDDACRAAGVCLHLIRCVVVCPPRFNTILDAQGSKGAVLAEGLCELLRASRTATAGEERMEFFVDKHGGRNAYAAQIQHAMAEGMVIVRQEGMARSVYEVMGLDREVRLTFQPRADSEHFCVALASMTSKYLRELLMLEFNQFWQKHAPGVKATAGYPGDASRFYAEIKPAAKRLGISKHALWRRK